MAGQNIDVSGYMNWEKITAPNGQVGYIVPGTGLVYDPFLSKVRGRNVFFQNTKPQLEAARKQEEEKQRMIDLAEKQASPVGQLLPIAGGIAGLTAARYIGNELLPSAADKAILAGIETSGTTAAGTAAGQAAGTVAGTAGTTAGEVAAGAAAGAPGTAAGAAAPGAFSIGGIGSAGNYILPAAGAFGAYNLLTTDNGPARGALQGAASGAAIGSGFGGAPGALIGAGIGGVLGIAESFLDNPSTKELEKKRWGKLKESGVVDAEAAFLANHPPGDTSVYQEGPRKGQKWTFENALEDAKKDPVHFRLVYGNYDTFGNDWSKYTPEQQDAIVSRLANEGLYAGRKGDVVITDKERARKIKDEILSGQTQSTAVTPEAAAKTQGPTQKQPLYMGGQLPAQSSNINYKSGGALPMGQAQGQTPQQLQYEGPDEILQAPKQGGIKSAEDMGWTGRSMEGRIKNSEVAKRNNERLAKELAARINAKNRK